MINAMPPAAPADEPSVLVYLLLIASLASAIAYIALILPHMIVFADSNRDGHDLLKSSGPFIAGTIIFALSIIAVTHAFGNHLKPDGLANIDQAVLISLAAVPVIISTGGSLSLMSVAWRYPRENNSLWRAGRKNAIISLVTGAAIAAAITTLIITAQTGSNPAG